MTTQGSRHGDSTNPSTSDASSNGHPITGRLVDLDALLAEHKLDPVPVKLKGKTYKVRRDLTGAQVAQCWKLINEGNDTDALAMLVSSPVVLNTVLEKLPQQHYRLAVQKILAAAGLINDEAGTAGE